MQASAVNFHFIKLLIPQVHTHSVCSTQQHMELITSVVIARTVHGSWHTRSGKSESWVVRFLRDLGLMDMGVSDKNIELCKNDSDKVSIAFNHCIGAMIDESYDCLQAVHRCLPECEKLCYSNSEDGPNRPTEPFEDTFWGTVEYHHPDWRAMARRFDYDSGHRGPY